MWEPTVPAPQEAQPAKPLKTAPVPQLHGPVLFSEVNALVRAAPPKEPPSPVTVPEPTQDAEPEPIRPPPPPAPELPVPCEIEIASDLEPRTPRSFRDLPAFVPPPESDSHLRRLSKSLQPDPPIARNALWILAIALMTIVIVLPLLDHC